MPNIFAIVQNTPIWVFVLLGALVWLGAQGLKARTVPLWRILITPAVFIAWGVISLSLRSAAAPMLVAVWAGAAIVGAALAWTTTNFADVQVDRTRGLVSLPGSSLPLTRNLLIFFAKYALTVAAVIAPVWRGDLAIWDVAISGASAGYFLAWLARLAIAYRQEPKQEPKRPLVAPAQS